MAPEESGENWYYAIGSRWRAGCALRFSSIPDGAERDLRKSGTEVRPDK